MVIHNSPIRFIVTVLFALAPWVTLGLGSPATFGVAAAMIKSRLLAIAAAVFAAAFVVMFIIAGHPDGTTQQTIFTWLFALNMIGGGMLAAATTLMFYRALAAGNNKPSTPGAQDLLAKLSADNRANLAKDPALRRAIGRQQRRQLAMEIVHEDPRLADELGIGRPDLERGFDDGGLVDVNDAPANVLARLPGFNSALAKQVVARRLVHGPFTSSAELIVHADVPHRTAEKASDRLVFRQRG